MNKRWKARNISYWEICPMCERVSAEVNFPNKKSKKVWGQLCVGCFFGFEMGMRKWRENVNPKLEGIKIRK
jgi:hypothetical protein